MYSERETAFLISPLLFSFFIHIYVALWTFTYDLHIVLEILSFHAFTLNAGMNGKSTHRLMVIDFSKEKTLWDGKMK